MTKLPAPLIDGYHRFKEGQFARDRARYRELAEKGQSPSILIISCCDSRVGPETIFNMPPGAAFVVRNVANLVPPYEPDGGYHGTSAALEFAIQSLKIREILVLGHGGCGGIKAALDPGGDPLSPGDFIGKWIELLDTPAKSIVRKEWMSPDDRQKELEHMSIRCSIDNLLTFPCVEILADKQRIGLHGAWFDIASGTLWQMDRETGEFAKV